MRWKPPKNLNEFHTVAGRLLRPVSMSAEPGCNRAKATLASAAEPERVWPVLDRVLQSVAEDNPVSGAPHIAAERDTAAAPPGIAGLAAGIAAVDFAAAGSTPSQAVDAGSCRVADRNLAEDIRMSSSCWAV